MEFGKWSKGSVVWEMEDRRWNIGSKVWEIKYINVKYGR